MATAFWLGRDPRLLYLMILSTGLGMVMMCGILTAEVIIVGPQGDGCPGHMATLFPAIISPRSGFRPLWWQSPLRHR